jgi:hypothetical protein
MLEFVVPRYLVSLAGSAEGYALCRGSGRPRKI